MVGFRLRACIHGLTPEVAEAAYLDGCNQWQTFYKVMFPLTGTSVAALTIFTAVFSQYARANVKRQPRRVIKANAGAAW